MQDLPTDATPREAAPQAHDSGGYTAVLKLAQERQLELQHEFATLTTGHEVRWMSNRERQELQRTWTPEKARLNRQIAELQRQISEWGFIEDQVHGFAANEAYGWTILPDGTPAKVLDNGKVLSSYGWVSEFTDSDGRRYTSDGPDEQWKRRHQRHAREFGDRVRSERLQNARSRTRTAPQQRTREHRPGSTRRTASSSSTSSSDPPDAESEPPRRRGQLRHISFALAAFLHAIGLAR